MKIIHLKIIFLKITGNWNTADIFKFKTKPISKFLNVYVANTILIYVLRLYATRPSQWWSFWKSLLVCLCCGNDVCIHTHKIITIILNTSRTYASLRMLYTYYTQAHVRPFNRTGKLVIREREKWRTCVDLNQPPIDWKYTRNDARATKKKHCLIYLQNNSFGSENDNKINCIMVATDARMVTDG